MKILQQRIFHLLVDALDVLRLSSPSKRLVQRVKAVVDNLLLELLLLLLPFLLPLSPNPFPGLPSRLLPVTGAQQRQ